MNLDNQNNSFYVLYITSSLFLKIMYSFFYVFVNPNSTPSLLSKIKLGTIKLLCFCKSHKLASSEIVFNMLRYLLNVITACIVLLLKDVLISLKFLVKNNNFYTGYPNLNIRNLPFYF